MKVITSENVHELQFLLDNLTDIVRQGGTVTIPTVLTVNKTGNKFTTEKNKETYVTVNQVEKTSPDVLKNPDSIYLHFIVSPEEKEEQAKA